MHRLLILSGAALSIGFGAQRRAIAQWQVVRRYVRKLFAVFRFRRTLSSYGHAMCSADLLRRDAVLSREPKIERLPNNVRSAIMKFVLVNDKAPRLPSMCAHCRTSIGTRYLRDLSSKRPYCGYACYLVRKTESVPVVWRFGAGIDGLPIRPL